MWAGSVRRWRNSALRVNGGRSVFVPVSAARLEFGGLGKFDRFGERASSILGPDSGRRPVPELRHAPFAGRRPAGHRRLCGSRGRQWICRARIDGIDARRSFVRDVSAVRDGTGTVTLTGRIDSLDSARLLEAIVRLEPGVHEVRSALVIDGEDR